MVDRITSEDFLAADGAGDWHVTDDVAHTTFATGSFVKGLDLVNEIGRLAEAANHHPDVTLTYPTVAISISTHEVDGLTQRDIDLAREISAAAKQRGISAGSDEG